MNTSQSSTSLERNRNLWFLHLNRWLCCFCLLLILPSHASEETGRYLMEKFTQQDLAMDVKNDDIVEDLQGHLYFAGNNQIHHFNGQDWRVIKTPVSLKPKALAVDHNGRLLISGIGGFGYLEVDSQSLLQFHWLFNEPVIGIDSSGIRDVVMRAEGAYFITSDAVYWWRQLERLKKVESAQRRFDGFFVFDGELLVYTKNQGLMSLTDGLLKTFANGDFFTDKSIVSLLRSSQRLLLVTKDNGLFQYRQNAFMPIELDKTVTDLLAEHQIAQAISLSNGLMALAVTGRQNQGLMLLDSQLKLHRLLTRKDRLSDDLINTLFEDSDNGLWLGMEDGIDRIEINSPLTYFDARDGLDGTVFSTIRYDEFLYAATNRGVYRLHSDGIKARFEKVQGASGICYRLYSTPNGLLSICSADVYHINGSSAKVIASETQHEFSDLFLFEKSPNGQMQVLLGHRGGLSLLTYEHNQWQYQRLASELIDFHVRSLAVDDKGVIWINSELDGIYRVIFPEGFNARAYVTYFDAGDGLPEGGIYPSRIGDNVVLNTDIGIYRYNDLSQQFQFDSRFTQFKGEKIQVGHSEDALVSILREGGNKNTAGYSGNRRVIAVSKELKQGRYIWDSESYHRVSIYPSTGIYSETNGVSWVLAGLRLMRYDLDKYNAKRQIATPDITTITALQSKQQWRHFDGLPSIKIPFGKNSIRVDASFMAMNARAENRFQYRLQGYDNQWSQWSANHQKLYVNLPQGDYVLQLRAKNVFADVVNAKSVALYVAPPWYQSIWAYLAYALLSLGFIWFLLHIRTRALLRKTAKLEAIIKQRTQSVTEGAALIEQQKQSIEQLLAQKNSLFANISHEFRTPLTLILGPINNLLKAELDKEKRGQLQLVRQSGYRLLRLVNQILALAKLSAIPFQDKVTLSLKDHVDFMMASFMPLAQDKQIALHVNDFEEVHLCLVADALEKILVNLLSNAIKYTPENGRIDLTIERINDSRILISVSDTGFGIPKDQLALVFTRFKRIDHPEHIKVQGTGLGLSMVKELVESHQGTITVESSLGQGSTFVVELPLNNDNPEQVQTSVGLMGAQNSVELELRALEEAPVSTKPQTMISGLSQDTENNSRLTLLVIEDTTNMRDFVISLFCDDFDVLSAPNGEQGLQLAQQHLPDIVISDLMMPGKDGYEVCHELKNDQLTSHIPVILLTAKADLQSRKRGWQEQADEYLAKPFDEEELKLRVVNLLAIRQTLKARFGRVLHEQPQQLPQLLSELNDKDQQFLQRFEALINSRYTDSELNLPTVAKAMFVSERLLQKKLKALIDHNFTEYLRTFRLTRAAQLLKAGQRSADVAIDTGFSSQAYFSRCFKAEFGMTATQFIQQNR